MLPCSVVFHVSYMPGLSAWSCFEELSSAAVPSKVLCWHSAGAELWVWVHTLCTPHNFMCSAKVTAIKQRERWLTNGLVSAIPIMVTAFKFITFWNSSCSLCCCQTTELFTRWSTWCGCGQTLWRRGGEEGVEVKLGCWYFNLFIKKLLHMLWDFYLFCWDISIQMLDHIF